MPENFTEEKMEQKLHKLSIFCQKGEKENSYPSAQRMFCLTIYGNANVTPSKLISHFTEHHSEHQNKSKEFF